MKVQSEAADRYSRIAALAKERDQTEARLDKVERELRTLVYRLAPDHVLETRG